MKTLFQTFVVAAALGLSMVAAAQHTRHAQPAAPRPELGASLAVDAAGVLWVVSKERDHVTVRRSTDAGVSWGAPSVVNAVGERIEASGDSRPKIAVGREGEIYVTWTKPFAKFHTGEVRFARSINGGRTFEPVKSINTDGKEITHRFDTLAVTGDGKVMVAWIDSRDGPTSLYYASSDDRGVTFSKERRAALGSCECCRISLLPQADGSALAFWRHVFEPNIRDHALVRVGADGFPGPVRRATFDDWRVDACPHQGPSLAQDGAGTLHGVWFSGTPGKEGVYYGRLAEGRVEGQRRVGGETAAHADIAIIDRKIAIAWKEFDGKVARLKAMRSDDAGVTWRELELARAEGATDQPRVVARSGRFLVMWNSAAQPLRVITMPEANAMAFDEKSLDSIRTRLAGKPFVLSFWSVHCEPCTREMALWRKLQPKYGDVPVILVATDPPAESDRVRVFLNRYDPGPVERWQYADDFDERIRFAVDPRWRGELPRTYFFNAAHKAEARSGVVDEAWLEKWLASASVLARH